MMSISFDEDVDFQLPTKATFVNGNTESQVESDIAKDKQTLILPSISNTDRKLFNTGIFNFA
jgi:hypothetical protein